jgi:hypothetical protein
MATAQSGAINWERIEEQRGQALAPPHIEEVVGRGARRNVAGELARQGSEDAPRRGPSRLSVARPVA